MKTLANIQSLSQYKKKKLRQKILVLSVQLSLLCGLIFIWELFANIGLINSFLVSKPTSILTLLLEYIKSNTIWSHIRISVIETMLGLIIGTILGFFIATLLYLFPFQS